MAKSCTGPARSQKMKHIKLISWTGLYQKPMLFVIYTSHVHIEMKRYRSKASLLFAISRPLSPSIHPWEHRLANTTFAPKKGHLRSRQRTISKGQGGLGGKVANTFKRYISK